MEQHVSHHEGRLSHLFHEVPTWGWWAMGAAALALFVFKAHSSASSTTAPQTVDNLGVPTAGGDAATAAGYAASYDQSYAEWQTLQGELSTLSQQYSDLQNTLAQNQLSPTSPVPSSGAGDVGLSSPSDIPLYQSPDVTGAVPSSSYVSPPSVSPVGSSGDAGGGILPPVTLQPASQSVGGFWGGPEVMAGNPSYSPIGGLNAPLDNMLSAVGAAEQGQKLQQIQMPAQSNPITVLEPTPGIVGDQKSPGKMAS